jgi:hypothetical protein
MFIMISCNLYVMIDDLLKIDFCMSCIKRCALTLRYFLLSVFESSGGESIVRGL